MLDRASVLDACEECFLVSLPKRVRIRNLRLGLLLLFLRLGALAWIIYLLYAAKPWYSQFLPTGSFAFWASSPQQFQQAVVADDLEVCNATQIHRYSYQYGADTSYRYTDIRCMDTLPGSRFTKSENELYIPTFFKEELIETRSVSNCASCPDLTCTFANGTYVAAGMNELEDCICMCSVENNRFVRGVSAINVSFEHSAQITWGPTNVASYNSQIVSDQLMTIVRHPRTKQTLRRFQPGATVTLPVSQLLELAEVSLQSPVGTTLANGLQVNYTVNQYPIVRMTGMLLNVALLYYNKDDAGHQSSHDGPVCYVELEPELIWSSRPRLDFGQPLDTITGVGSLRHRYYYGIRIKFTASGSFSRLDPWTLAMYIVACVVYLQLPGAIVDIIVTYFLGNLSMIYRCVTLPVVTTTALISGMLARSLAAKAAFEGLLRKQRQLAWSDEEDPDRVMTLLEKHCELRGADNKDPCNQLLREQCELPGPDKEDPDRVISVSSLDSMIQDLLSQKELGEVSKSLSEADMETIRNQLLGAGGKMGLREGDFIWASANNEGDGEAVTFQLLATWFKGDRRQGLLERAFDNTRTSRLRWRGNTMQQIVPQETVVP